MHILLFNWLICLYHFMSLVRIASFLIVKNSFVREELIDLPFFLQTQLQQITVQEHIFGAFTVLNKNYEKARTKSSKNREKKNDPKSRNGKILRTFGPYIF